MIFYILFEVSNIYVSALRDKSSMISWIFVCLLES